MVVPGRIRYFPAGFFLYPMPKDPAFLFYPADWIGGVMGMTYEEKGAYITALMVQFNLGRQPEKIFLNELGQAWHSIKHKFKEQDGLYFNERLEIEKEKRKNYVASRHKNKAGNNQHKTKDMTGHMTSHMVNVNVNKDLNKLEGGMGGDFNWESVKQYFLNADEWMYKFCTSKAVSRETLVLRMNEFLNDIELRNEYKPLKDLQSHFTNWFNKSEKLKKNAKPNKNSGRDELLESLRQKHAGNHLG